MSYTVYPVQKVDYEHLNYKVYIDGKEVALNSARVSRCPMNRRWPGHQRQIDQTEIINFLSLSMENPIKIKVVPNKKSEKIEIRPKSLEITPKINIDGSFEFTLDKPVKLSVEPYGVDNPLLIFADERKNYNIDFNDKNVLYFGAGVHDLGYYEMKDNEVIFIDEGAVVYATINAFNVNNIKIIGRGILDNSKNVEKIMFQASVDGTRVAVNNAVRINAVEIDCCDNVEIDGITIRDSLLYNINLCSCKNAVVNNVKMIGNWRYNSDGMHFVNCIDSSLTNSFIRTFDDGIIIRGFESNEYEKCSKIPNSLHDCKNILIKNNIVWNDWDVAIRIGACSLSNDICDVLVENNDIIHFHDAALDCINCDYGDVHNFIYRNINIEFDDLKKVSQYQYTDEEKYCEKYQDINVPLCIILFRIIFHPEYSNVKYNPDKKLGQLHDILFENINLYGKQDVFLMFEGLSEKAVCRNMTVKNIYKNNEILKKDDVTVQLNDFTENINYIANE